MPPALIPIIALVGSLAFGGTELGLSLSNQPGTPSTKPTPTDNASAIAQAQQNRTTAVSQAQTQLPGLQESTSGGVSPGYLQDLSAINSGNANLIGSPQLQQAVSSFLGTSGGGSAAPGGGSVLPGLTPNVSPGVSSASNAFLASQDAAQSNPFSGGGGFF